MYNNSILAKNLEMTSTFYIPKDKEEIQRAFVKACNKVNKSYSSVLVQFMDDFSNGRITTKRLHKQP